MDDTDVLFCGLKDFLCEKLLFWIEAMNLIGAKTECPALSLGFQSSRIVTRRPERLRTDPQPMLSLCPVLQLPHYGDTFMEDLLSPFYLISILSNFSQQSLL
jgi:hypothetical protein